MLSLRLAILNRARHLLSTSTRIRSPSRYSVLYAYQSRTKMTDTSIQDLKGSSAPLPPAPYQPQDLAEVKKMVDELEDRASQGRSRKTASVTKNRYQVHNSPSHMQVDSWKMSEQDYKLRDLPTYARGLFTTTNSRGVTEIVSRGYDKFFNTDEVYPTKWDNIFKNTQGPYELTLKENGCIIFISGLEDGTLLVCSKHSTGPGATATKSHSSVGQDWIERQLQSIGRSPASLAQELRKRNVTAVAELCDDAFEEHILEYGPEKAGLYLHGMNLNVPKFATYPSLQVQAFADEWGFRKTGVIVMDDIHQVKGFLEDVAESGAYDGRDIEGFVIRCRMSPKPDSLPYSDWFFKYKFEEPYLMYRQWRECTKALISGKPPRFKKHMTITQEYLVYAKKRLAADKKLAERYRHNHGIISLRNDFLAFKHLKGSEAAQLDLLDPRKKTEDIEKDVIITTIATIGCGKTTVSLALCKLFGWGHVQNDNITGKNRPIRFVNQCFEELQKQPVVIADRNNAQKREREQLIKDVELKSEGVVALNFLHDKQKLNEIREVTRQRVLARGDNHQTIHAETDASKFMGVMEGFISRFEPCDLSRGPDDKFDLVIDLDPVAGSRKNLEIVVRKLFQVYPKLIKQLPTSEQLDEAFQYAIQYQPTLRHDIDSKKKGNQQNNPSNNNSNSSTNSVKLPKKPALEYMAVFVPAQVILEQLSSLFAHQDAETVSFYEDLQRNGRIQEKFHVTLLHRSGAKDHSELWNRYLTSYNTAIDELWSSPGATVEEVREKGIFSMGPQLGACGVVLERVVWDSRLMAFVVRLVNPSGEWSSVNSVAHITVGTRDASIKPKESNDLLVRWLQGRNTQNIRELAVQDRREIPGAVHGVPTTIRR